MLIDWFTTIAQLINFLILVWLLKRFLYKPILKAIDDREIQITDKLLTAERIKSEAEVTSKKLQRKIEEIDDQRSSLIEKVTTEVEVEHQEMLKELQESFEKLEQRKRIEFNSEAQEVYQKVIEKTQKEVFAIVRKVLQELSGRSLELQIFEIFNEKLRGMNIDNVQLEKVDSSKDDGVIKSTVELSKNQQMLIEETIKGKLGRSIKIIFEIDPNLFCGIEFVFNGKKLTWSIENYLSSIEKEVDLLLTKEKTAI